MRGPSRRAALVLWLLSRAVTAAAETRDPGVLALPGLIIDEQMLARPGGRAAANPAVRATAGLDAAAAARLAELAALRDAAAKAAPAAAFDAIPLLPGDAAAPARVDSGDADPDRLHSTPPPPAP